MTKVDGEISTADESEGADAAERLARSTGPPVPVSKEPPFLITFYRSAVAKKWLMAITGIALFGFVVAHMVGNLKVFLGMAHLNEYAEWLRDLGEPAFPRTVLLWGMRIGLLVAVAVHIIAAAQLTRITTRLAR